ncbi:MAG: hypothetical protein AAB654_19670 [Acidobacteriota bacterium]
MHTAIAVVLASALALSLAACGGGAGTPTSPTSTATGAPTAAPTPTPTPSPAACASVGGFSMSATVDGAAWCGSATQRATYIASNGWLQVGASGAYSTGGIDIVFMLKTGGRPGTYTVSDRDAELAALVTQKLTPAGSQTTWAVNYYPDVLGGRPGGTGTVTITAISATGAAGSFTLSALPYEGAPEGTKSITNGVFSVTF